MLGVDECCEAWGAAEDEGVRSTSISVQADSVAAPSTCLACGAVSRSSSPVKAIRTTRLDTWSTSIERRGSTASSASVLARPKFVAERFDGHGATPVFPVSEVCRAIAILASAGLCQSIAESPEPRTVC